MEELQRVIGEQAIRLAWYKKSLELPIKQRLEMIEPSNDMLSIKKQCEMVNIQRSSYYDFIKEKVPGDQSIKEKISAIYTKRPSYGSRRITEIVRRHSITIDRKKTQRLMRALQGLLI